LRKRTTGDKVDPEVEAAEMEKAVKKKTEQTLMERTAEKLHLGK
jgi:hypothetical protein